MKGTDEKQCESTFDCLKQIHSKEGVRSCIFFVSPVLIPNFGDIISPRDYSVRAYHRLSLVEVWVQNLTYLCIISSQKVSREVARSPLICTCCSSLSANWCHELIHFGNYILDRSLLANYFAQSFGPFPAAINDHRGKRLYRQVLAKSDVAAVLDLAEPRIAASDDVSHRIRPIPPLRRELAEFDPEGPARLAKRGVEPETKVWVGGVLCASKSMFAAFSSIYHK